MYRLNILLKQDQKLFHTSDLAILWRMKNKNTLYTTIKRYVQKGILIPIHKGFYSTIPLDQIDDARLGIGYLHRFAYLSCETVLVKAGVIFQKVYPITLVSDISKKFKIKNRYYSVRKLKNSFLHNNIGINNINGVNAAIPERACADILYFNPHFQIDAKKMLNWKKVRNIQKEVGYK